ncbi:MAG: acyltransferase [Desulfovibrio sp.]|jgi:hypothetical protein|nr:acyltransferase [Desulfovibrio sp.]
MTDSFERANRITLLKTLCLLAVIVMHSVEPYTEPGTFWKVFAHSPDAGAEALSDWLSPLIIPSFMFASGYLMTMSLERSGRGFAAQAARRARRLLVPWLCTTLFWLAPTYTLFDLPAYNHPAGTPLWRACADGALGLFSDHLWFLLTLFWVSLFWLTLRPLLKGKSPVAGFALAFLVSWLMLRHGRGLTWFCLWETAGPLIHFYLGLTCFRCREELDSLFRRRKGECLGATALLYVLFAGSDSPPQPLYWLAGCVGALLAYQTCLHLADAVYERLRGLAWYRYFEDNAFRFYLFHMPGALLAFKTVDRAFDLPTWPAVILAFALNMTGTALVVALSKLLEERVLPGVRTRA